MLPKAAVCVPKGSNYRTVLFNIIGSSIQVRSHPADFSWSLKHKSSFLLLDVTENFVHQCDCEEGINLHESLTNHLLSHFLSKAAADSSILAPARAERPDVLNVQNAPQPGMKVELFRLYFKFSEINKKDLNFLFSF